MQCKTQLGICSETSHVCVHVLQLVHKVKANYLIEQLSPWNADKHSQSQVATMVEQLWTCLNTIGVRTLQGGPLADPRAGCAPPNGRGAMIF